MHTSTHTYVCIYIYVCITYVYTVQYHHGVDGIQKNGKLKCLFVFGKCHILLTSGLDDYVCSGYVNVYKQYFVDLYKASLLLLFSLLHSHIIVGFQCASICLQFMYIYIACLCVYACYVHVNMYLGCS